jgi:hypothetical protein
MEYLTIAYALIAVVLIGYAMSLQQRRATIERERALLESKKD